MSGGLRYRAIDEHDAAGQLAFDRYVARVFPEISFARWRELGGWNQDYRAHALFDGDEIVANVSVQRMQLLVEGEARTGWQLGAVGVVPERRGSGFQREVLPRAIACAGPDDLVFLFANDTVLEFYPRFGFRHVEETVFAVDARLEPEPSGWRRLVLDSASDRELVLRLARAAAPVTHRFGARDYGGILLWYWANFYADHLHYDATSDALLIVQQIGSTLRLCDVVAAQPVDLLRSLPGVLTRPIRRIELGFTPELVWPEAKPLRSCDDGFLFVRGGVRLPELPFKFPMLAQT